MNDPYVLITGANGEIGHGLITSLSQTGKVNIIALDLQSLDPSLRPLCQAVYEADILDQAILQEIEQTYPIQTIYHLASILSTQAEKNPTLAHKVNIEGTLNLIHFALRQAEGSGSRVKFLYPSSIAVYGFPDLETKHSIEKVVEDQWCCPTTMYGCNKLYAEHLGKYYDRFYPRFKSAGERASIDFRALRFPGLISADTLPTGGTTDYGPEMLHHAAQGLSYNCFVRADTRLPFMAMPDAINALLQLEVAPAENLSRHVYNVTSFSPTAEEIYSIVRQAFPEAEVRFITDKGRQAIVDAWPMDIDDSAACQDWGWEPEFDLQQAFQTYLLPAVQRRYEGL